MKKYLAVLGRQPLISVAELESLFGNVALVNKELAEFSMLPESPRDLSGNHPNLNRLGGTQKIAEEIREPIVEFLGRLPSDGKITLGVSDYSHGANAFRAQGEALKLKRILTKMGRSVRVVPNKEAVLSSATSLHNRLFKENRIEILKVGKHFFRVVGVQNIEAYATRDQARPARDAKVGMLPPKLAQVLINLCGNEPEGSVLLDPFCGTGVVLQEAALMKYDVVGSDLSERMVEYTRKNLDWACRELGIQVHNPLVVQGDARLKQWKQPIDLVACETYLGPPMSLPPAEIKLKEVKQECGGTILGFLKNLSKQMKTGAPITIAVPAWLRADGHYERLKILDEIDNLGYNVKRFRNLGQEDLLYYRDGQVVAREIIILRKK